MVHFPKRNIQAILCGMMFVVVLSITVWLVWDSYNFQELFGHVVSTGPGVGPDGILISWHGVEHIQRIIRASAALIIAVFTLCALLMWYVIRSRILLARAASIRKKSHERYRFLTEGLPTIGILRFSLADFRVIDCNRAALNITGMPRAEFVGRPVTDFVDPRDLNVVMLELEELRGGRASHYFPVKMVHYNGGTQYIGWHIAVIRQPDEEPQAVAIMTDVSKEQKLQIERMEKERLAGVLQMAGAAAHELNQPIQAVSGMLYMAMQKVDKHDPLYKSLETISSEVERMTAISRKISGISSYETKEYVGDTKIIDIDAAAGNRRNTLRRGSAQRRVP